jgi:hypothetical protein
MRQSVHDSLVKFRANAELVAMIRKVARSQHKTPSEYMRSVLHEQTKEHA